MTINVEETGFAGLKLIKPKKFGDERGFFSEVYSVRSLAEVGIHDTFVQDNHSFSSQRGVVRGLHFQSPPFSQGKLLRVTRGAIFDVAVDVRIGSPTYGKHYAVELSAENWFQIYLPPGFAHGFATLTEDCEVLYKVSALYSPPHEQGIRWDDPALAIAWPVAAADAILSDRDRKHVDLAALQSPFRFGAP